MRPALRPCSLDWLPAMIFRVAAVILAVAMTAPASAASYPNKVLAHQAFTTTDGGMAVLGSHYAAVGTSFDANNTLYIYDLRRRHLATQWKLPVLRGANAINRAYTMDSLRVSPNNHWLYVVNHMRADIVAIDLTGHAAPRSIGFDNFTPNGLVISRDSRYLYVSGTSLLTGNGGTAVYDTVTSTVIGHLPASTSLAIGAHGSVYLLLVSRGQARVWKYGVGQRSGRLLAAIRGPALAATTGSLALSPDGRRLYVLWNGLRALDPRSGHLIAALALPLFPQYTRIAVSPNGRQAMLWTPDVVQWFDTPTDNPRYIEVHYGFVAGALLPVDLPAMKPLLAHLPGISTPHAVRYTADSRLVVVAQASSLEVLSTGTSGRPTSKLPPISLAQPGGSGGATIAGPTPTPGALAASPTAGKGSAGCSGRNLTGSWQYADPRMNSSLAVTLRQTGTAISGTLVDAGGRPWSMEGTIQGDQVVLRIMPQGEDNPFYQGTFTGSLSADGTTIAGSAVYAGVPVTNVTLTGQATGAT